MWQGWQYIAIASFFPRIANIVEGLVTLLAALACLKIDPLIRYYIQSVSQSIMYCGIFGREWKHMFIASFFQKKFEVLKTPVAVLAC